MRDETFSGDRSLYKTAQTFTGVLVHDGADLDRFATLAGIELKIDRPHYGPRPVGWCNSGSSCVVVTDK